MNKERLELLYEKESELLKALSHVQEQIREEVNRLNLNKGSDDVEVTQYN